MIKVQEMEMQRLLQEYEGVMINTVRRIFPEGIASTKSGVLSFEDLMQEAALALLEAKRRYRPEKKGACSFKSYVILTLRSVLLSIYSRRPLEEERWTKESKEKGEKLIPEEQIPSKEHFIHEIKRNLLLEKIRESLTKYLTPQEAAYGYRLILLREQGYTLKEISQAWCDEDQASIYTLWDKVKRCLKKVDLQGII